LIPDKLAPFPPEGRRGFFPLVPNTLIHFLSKGTADSKIASKFINSIQIGSRLSIRKVIIK
jgi:hypothetical protein